MGEYELIQADCLEALRSMPDNAFDAVISDPPYSSGGLFASQRRNHTGDKYTNDGWGVDFNGDNMDQRSWSRWTGRS